MRQERLAFILDRLAAHGSVTVTGLCTELGASPASIRRDLQTLEDQQLLKRTHGGAVGAGVTYELPVRYRAGRHDEEKARIAAAAVALVTDEVHTIGLNGGTTTTELARRLAALGRPLTVVTNALNIAGDLAVRPSIELVVTGGRVRPESYELVGPIADRALSGISLDVAFLGVDGVDAIVGITTHDEVEAQTDHHLIAAARRVVVLADGSKIKVRAFSRIAETAELHILVTDATADPAELDRLRAAGVQVHVA
ncbi:DeoR family transcriptional regulator [Actinocorallia herbida]|uniref:DeoR family transcriptional regulator n=1 Tax=Actinocorallia herbida TaxID=58109 RepID=A0A3N1D0E1_9ACTN|nr:DeoR/GlpR family DNA-binding transcription regulator [Actinocorallia herbida]ROO86980.1 DeoR family transcriptional regulator [Actinocorallia herbida]